MKNIKWIAAVVTGLLLVGPLLLGNEADGSLNVQNGNLSFVLKSKAVVSDNIVRVRDVAVMDPYTKSRIGGLVLTVAPELGFTSSLAKNEIMEKLIGNGFQINAQQMRGPANVKISRQGLVVKPSYFTQDISRYIAQHSRWKDGFTVTIVSAKDIVVPEAGVRWQLIPANGQDFFGNVLFKVDAFSNEDNTLLYSSWIVAKLKISKRVAVSNRHIPKDQIIGSDDVRWEEREITVFTKDALLEEQEIVGRKSGRIIQPNSVITAGLMAKEYMVLRGGTALLTARLNNVKASSRVTVLANGGIGDSVRCMNTASKKIISATVTGKNALEVIVE